MNKLFMLILLSIINMEVSQAQQVAGNTYDDYKLYRNATEHKPEVINKMKALLATKLTPKQITNIQYHIGRIYEEIELPDSAIAYYEKSLSTEPNYEVIHRALGFIYLNKTKPIVAEMNDATNTQNADKHAQAYAKYNAIVLKALPYLEKYQACDADEIH